MIIVRLMGGLGNQMFQYSLGKSLSLKYNKELKIDLSYLQEKNRPSNFIIRNYDLNIFKIEDNFSLNENYLEISEKIFGYDESMLKLIDRNIDSSNILISGYFQTPLYFQEYDSHIRECFSFKENLISSKDSRLKSVHSDIIESNSVMINFRRSDFLNNDFHGVIGLDYVNRAIEILNIENPKFFVFSDDINWCLENVKLKNLMIVDHSLKGDRFSYYLQLMMSCKNFIIPNSSFAWWAAYLSENPYKKIICPTKWFNDSSIDTKDLIPKDWIRI